ncbi:hypothetical protein TcCL_NonESM06039 [Trypanosoma cruzi]|nr:hypothetical protein TcCL_NonESM06039 [Trypanosoma cruzi]
MHAYPFLGFCAEFLGEVSAHSNRLDLVEFISFLSIDFWHSRRCVLTSTVYAASERHTHLTMGGKPHGEKWFKGRPGSSCGNLAVDPPMHVGSSKNRVLGRGAPNAPRGYVGPRIGT